MKMNKLRGTSADAVLLMLVKLVTIIIGFVTTRLLSQYLSVYDYGTYSQILLIVSTVAMLSILGMVDGVNYFYYSVNDELERETYVSTIYALQCIISMTAGILVLLLSSPLCAYFKNQQIGRLLVFAAIFPILQNILSMTHVLIVAVGKAKMLAIRNLLFSVIRLVATVLAAVVVKNITLLLLATLLSDVAEIVWFSRVLRRNGCTIRLRQFAFRHIKEIVRYCVPMAMFTVISALNRDLDKYLIAWVTNTETLAVYTNASKALPFDVVMNSFCTVLVPHITNKIASKEYESAADLYRNFLEIAYISTGILCCTALAVAPQLMQLLYSEKYLGGLQVFCIYILVDLLRFANITLILAAAGKTQKLMLLALGNLVINALMNVLLYRMMGVPGPALATLVVTLLSGLLILQLSAKELNADIIRLFDGKKVMVFVIESIVITFAFVTLRKLLLALHWHYLLIAIFVGGVCAGILLLLNGKYLWECISKINNATGR